MPYPLATEDDLQETVRHVERTGRQMLAQRADVRSLPELKAAVDAGVGQFGRLDTVIANAGISTMGEAPTEDEQTSVWDNTIAVNLTGVWNTVRATAPIMKSLGNGGSIVLVSSSAGLANLKQPGAFGGESYGAAKHGIVGLMRQFANELACDWIRVNSIHPCGVDTPMINNPAMNAWFESVFGGHNIGNLLPVGVLAPDDISDTVIFLASDMARYITGVALPVDAGFMVK